ncbi:hypothetical protein BaRGS_00031727, partial [Batillaria attramentaria]
MNRAFEDLPGANQRQPSAENSSLTEHEKHCTSMLFQLEVGSTMREMVAEWMAE